MKHPGRFTGVLKYLRFPRFFVVLAFPLLFVLAFNQFKWLQEINVRGLLRSGEIVRYSIRRLVQNAFSEVVFLPLNISTEGVSKSSFAGFFHSWRRNSSAPEILSDFFYIDADFDEFYCWTENGLSPVSVETPAAQGSPGNSAARMRMVETIKKNRWEFAFQQSPVSVRFKSSDTVFPFHFFSEGDSLYCFVNPSSVPEGECYVFVFDRVKIKTELMPLLAAEVFGKDFEYEIGIFDERADTVLYTNADMEAAAGGALQKVSLSYFFRPGGPPPLFLFQKSAAAELDDAPSEEIDTGFFGGKNLGFFADFFPEVSVAPDIADQSFHARYAAGTARNIFITVGICVLVMASFFLLAYAENRAKNLAVRQREFIATITHELKTPIAVISSAGQNLTAGIVKDKDKIQKYGELIKNEADRLALSVNHYLLYAGTDPSLPEREMKRLCSVRDILLSVLKSTESERNRLGFVCSTNLPGDDSPEGTLCVRGNPVALEAAFSNIVLNALRHASSGKFVGVTAWAQRDFPVFPAKKVIKPMSPVKKNNESGFVCVSVADKGNGIEERELKTIFEPFVRGKDALKNQIPGNGIGLSLVAKVVAVHGGLIYIETKKSGGTVFTIVLPAADSSEEK